MSGSVLHILNGERGLDTYPSVYNAMYVLAQHGLINSIATAGAVNEFESVIKKHYPLRGGYLNRARQMLEIEESFDTVVVYEPRDVEIYHLAKILGARLKPSLLVHHCLEIPTAVLCRPGLKRLVHRCLYQGYREVNWILLQDESRKKLFQSCFPNIKHTSFALVPNSYIVDIEPMASALPWFDELRRMSRRLVTYAGAIESWAISLEFVTELKKMKDVSFLFSGWSNDGLAEELIRNCTGVNHIHFDLGKKDRAELNYIVSKSDMGLIFYDSTDSNIADTGLSSGKLHKFLSYSKPVLVNYIPSLAKFLEVNGFGVSVAPSSMVSAIESVLHRLDEYGVRIRDHYPQMCDFRNAYEKFVGQIECVKHNAEK